MLKLPHEVFALMFRRRTLASRLPAVTTRDDRRVHELQALDGSIAAACKRARIHELTAWRLFDGR